MNSIKIIIVLILVFFLAGCGGKKAELTSSKADATKLVEKKNLQNKQEDSLKVKLQQDSVENLVMQVVKSDNHLRRYKNSYNVDVLSIEGTEFAINGFYTNGTVFLMSSQQPYSKKIKKVIKYITSIFGTPEVLEDDNYVWADFHQKKDAPKIFFLIHLKSINSEEGGTKLIFQVDWVRMKDLILKQNSIWL